MKRKNCILLVFVIFLIIFTLNVQPVSKTKQITCLRGIVDTDIKELGAGAILKKDKILETLSKIRTAFKTCQIEESEVEAIEKILNDYEDKALQLNPFVNHPNSSKQYSNGLMEKFNNLIWEINSSLNEINKAAKEKYLKDILNNEIKQLKSISDKEEVKNRLESIRDKLEDYNNIEIEEGLKKEILLKLEEFINEATNRYNSELDENQKKSEYFSSWLQEKFGDIILGKNIKTSRAKTPFSPEKTKNDGLGKIETGVLLLIAVGAAVFVYYLFKKRRKSNEASGEEFLTVAIDSNDAKGNISHENSLPLDEIRLGIIGIRKIIDTEFSGIKAEIEIIKSRVEILNYKTDIDDIKTKVRDLKNFVDEMENDIPQVFKTRFDYLDNQNKSDSYQMKEINEKLSKIFLQIIRIIKETEIEKEELKKKETGSYEIGVEDQKRDEVKVIETKPEETRYEQIEVKEQEEGETYSFEADDKNLIHKIKFGLDLEKQIVKGFEKNKEKIMQFVVKIEQGDNIKNWILEILKKSESTTGNDKESFFRYNVYPGLYEFASKISKSEYRELKEVFLNSLFDALDIEEFGRENDIYAPYMHDLLKDRGRASGILNEVFSPGYKLKSTGKVIIKAKVGL